MVQILRKRNLANAGLILLYHRVARLSPDPWQLAVSPHNFRQQMQVVRDRCCAVSLAELPHGLRRRRARRPMVVVTFDDGYADNLHEALPVLEQLEIPATFFLTITWTGPPREFWWDELERIFLQPGTLPPVLRLASDAESPTWHLGDAVDYAAEDADRHGRWCVSETPPTVRHQIYSALWQRLYALTPARRQTVLDEISNWAAVKRLERPTHRRLNLNEVVALSRRSGVEIGAHTVNHAVLPDLPRVCQEQEIGSCSTALQDVAGCPITSFAYPHGHYCQETILLVQQTGMARACTTEPNPVRTNHDCFQLPRYTVGNWNSDTFAERISQWQHS